ncbi:universal stress protein [Pseudarthrobacter sp. S9]|uniref:universal stress protein n=1 Tax=Pseudarthrobacter sp. S9 TaxID=3418421 RepID=UPI003CFD3CCB
MTSTGSFAIVVGFDGSEHSHNALRWAKDEARRRNGQLRLIRAWSKPPMAWYPAVLETAAGEIAAEDSPNKSLGCCRLRR